MLRTLLQAITSGGDGDGIVKRLSSVHSPAKKVNRLTLNVNQTMLIKIYRFSLKKSTKICGSFQIKNGCRFHLDNFFEISDKLRQWLRRAGKKLGLDSDCSVLWGRFRPEFSDSHSSVRFLISTGFANIQSSL